MRRWVWILIWTVMLGIIAWAVECRAAETGWMSPAATSTSSFTTPSNAFTSNDLYASAAVLNDTLRLKNFGFTFTNFSAVDSIIIRYEYNTTQVGTGNATIQANASWDNGASFSTAVSAVKNATVDVTERHGNVAPGRTWLEADFSNANFVARLKQTAGDDFINVDLLQVNVYYSQTAAGNIRRQRMLKSEILEEKNEEEYSRLAPSFIFWRDGVWVK